jgi:hypothetical protein
MKIIDKTPFRQQDGSISLIDRIQGTLKYGLSWYGQMQAQEKVIPIFEKHLGRNFILMRNVTLAGTEIELPMILIGPPAVLVVNVINEQGIFRAQEDEWGKISGNQIVPAKINHLARTARMAKVLQVFLSRSGVESVTVDSLLLSANPGTHVESIRPIVRVVMSDALERFAASFSQSKASLGPEECAGIAQVILHGKAGSQSAELDDKPEPQENASSVPEVNQYFFQDETPPVESSPDEFSVESDEQKSGPGTKPDRKAKPARKKKMRILGLTIAQLGILAGILLTWLCVIILFLIFITVQFNV